MNEKKRTAVDALNEMFWSQSVEFREEYRRNYFTLLEYIVEPEITYDEAHQRLREKERMEQLVWQK
ncbi:MAG: hypothetical protein IJV24_07250 [Prevotella sp.]|nr:hypothetical protein [Prevotella sp.]